LNDSAIWPNQAEQENWSAWGIEELAGSTAWVDSHSQRSNLQRLADFSSFLVAEEFLGTAGA
jgi:hypothetical protein